MVIYCPRKNCRWLVQFPKLAQAGMGVEVAVYQSVDVNIMRVFPLKLRSLDFQAAIVSLIFSIRGSMLILVQSTFPK